MNIIKFSGGHDFSMKNGPNNLVSYLGSPDLIGLVPPRTIKVKAKVLIKVGETVKLGQILFYDKKNVHIKFTSPTFGTITNILYGNRRVLKAVEIKKQILEDSSFIQFDKKNIDKISSSQIVSNLINSGIWSKFRIFPGFEFLSDQADFLERKSILFISLFSTEPHVADIQLLLNKKTYMKLFLYGLKTCSKIFKKIYIFNNKNTFPEKISEFSKNLNNIFLYNIEDKYPSDNPGLQCYFTNSLGLDSLNVHGLAFNIIEIGHLFIKGQMMNERFISISGNGIKECRNVIVNSGVSIKHLLQNLVTENSNDYRILSGGILTGKKIFVEDYLADEDISLQVLLEDRKRTLFSFFRLGLNDFTLLKTWVSGFFPKNDYNISTSNNGEERACIQCGYCFEICPVKLMPSLLMKSAVTNDIEKMEYLNISDCIECELCTFICPSKIEIGQHIKYGKEFIKKEG